MKSYIISENRDSFLGMKLAGIQGIYVRDTVDIERAFKGALKNPEIGIIYLTEKAYLKIEDLVLESKRKNLFPLITVIPDRYGYERQQGVITQYIKESVGL
ncbi:MAG: V-type ATP synthase subunit F [Eubacterium aggregans]|jgi:V/A-type H+-transporting ATPase subunit F|uniref:V/A-type H+-transporting ATPase subunit F n=1 Tax=Eubacterium aggregans TaxID=81409 RepID=A0A1H4E6J5_9FIRM|nr:V-type ATP synthase subunit F [Eubacterium aggregans]MEA5074603.1 V-type ATP synthase subunit F [Eubacterium aggregans]SEA80704.1 V/A-type H+-transporting ATPase subunit F [Eubacterium aggregans]